MKPCKGNYKVGHFEGCGTEAETKRTYGLCPKCLYKWTQTTLEGDEWFKKQTAYKTEKNQREKKKEQRAKDKATKIELMSNIEYWSKVLQPNINLIARLIDQHNPCIATENFGKMNGGHYISVGACRTISLNLHNIFIQSFESNHFKSGDTVKFQSGLRRTFGEDYFNWVEGLRQTPSLNITKIEMKVYNERAKEYIKALRRDPDVLRGPKSRIDKRNDVNEFLGIYDEKYCKYKY